MLTFELFDMKNGDKDRFYHIMGDIFSFKKGVRKDLPYLDNDPERKWILLFDNNELIGFGSYEIKENICKFKNDYIFPKLRRQGYFRKLFRKRISIIQLNQNIENIIFKATIIPELYSVYYNYGFQIKEKNGNFLKVEKTDLFRYNITIVENKNDEEIGIRTYKKKFLNINNFILMINEKENQSIDNFEKYLEKYEGFVKDQNNDAIKQKIEKINENLNTCQKQNNEEKEKIKRKSMIYMRPYNKFIIEYKKKYPEINIKKLRNVWRENKNNIQSKYIQKLRNMDEEYNNFCKKKNKYL